MGFVLRVPESPSDPHNLDQPIHKEVFLPRLLHMLDNRPEPLPLFLPLKPLSRKTINPGWTGTSRSSMKFCAFVVKALPRCFHPERAASRTRSSPKSQSLSRPSRLLSEARGQPSVGQVTRAESREILCNFLLSNSLRKKRYDLLKGCASAAKKRFSSHYIVTRSNASSAPAEC